jgi:ADP-ribose pyrophosphatase YjhB (NUDIX family)
VLVIKTENRQFQYRIAGVLIHQGHVLLHRKKWENVWALPGGRGEWFEPSDQTIVREFEEELGICTEVERLLWVSENFFPYNKKQYHEINFFYLLKSEEVGRIFTLEPFSGLNEDQDRLEFRWVPLSGLDNYRLYPNFLYSGLLQLPQTVQHVIYTENSAIDE